MSIDPQALQLVQELLEKNHGVGIPTAALEHVIETGHLPGGSDDTEYSEQEQRVLDAVKEVVGRIEPPPVTVHGGPADIVIHLNRDIKELEPSPDGARNFATDPDGFHRLEVRIPTRLYNEDDRVPALAREITRQVKALIGDYWLEAEGPIPPDVGQFMTALNQGEPPRDARELLDAGFSLDIARDEDTTPIWTVIWPEHPDQGTPGPEGRTRDHYKTKMDFVEAIQTMARRIREGSLFP